MTGVWSFVAFSGEDQTNSGALGNVLVFSFALDPRSATETGTSLEASLKKGEFPLSKTMSCCYQALQKRQGCLQRHHSRRKSLVLGEVWKEGTRRPLCGREADNLSLWVVLSRLVCMTC